MLSSPKIADLYTKLIQIILVPAAERVRAGVDEGTSSITVDVVPLVEHGRTAIHVRADL